MLASRFGLVEQQACSLRYSSMRLWALMLVLLTLGCDRSSNPPEAGDVESLPSPIKFTFTEHALLTLRQMASRMVDDQPFYVYLAAKANANGVLDYDVQILRTLDSKQVILQDTQGIQLAIAHGSVALLQGAVLDYQIGGEQPGFRFKNSDDAPTASERPTPEQEHPALVNATIRKADPYSNIYAKDYVGPDTCTSCHAKQLDLWQAHPHSKMNQNVSDASVLGDFSNITLHYGQGHVIFRKAAEAFLMDIHHRDQWLRRYQVTRTVGSKVFQMYIGRQVAGPEPKSDPIYQQERKLPFTYLIKRGEWFPETYDEPQYRPEYTDYGELTAEHAYHTRNFRPVWQESCLWCHNTYPYNARLQKRMGGFPPKDIALEKVLNPILFGNSLRTHALDESQLTTMGISCESCHFGGREHVIEQREIRFLPSGKHLKFPKATPTLTENARQSPYVVNAICAQCHSAGQPKFPNGSSTWNSSESLDMQTGHCSTQIKCVDCHNPHRELPENPLADLNHGSMRSVQSCVRCHEPYRDPQAAAKHAGHPLTSKVSCLDCHMPKIVHGRDRMVHSHHISSPTDPKMLALGAPNACNLCHLDKPISWTLQELNRGWGKDLQATAQWLRAYDGSLDEPVGHAWLKHPGPMVRKAAASAYGESPLGKQELPYVLPILMDSVPSNRFFGMFAVEKILGRQLAPEEYRPWHSPQARRKEVINLLTP